MSKFYLMNKDTVVLKFSDKLNIDGDYVIEEIFDDEKLPYILKYDIGDLKHWFKSRVVPSNRNYLDKLIKVLGLEEKSVAFEYLKLNNGFSLNDSYWIKPLNIQDIYPKDLSWNKYNLYNNKFEEYLGFITFFGNNISSNKEIYTSKVLSPELTTRGVMGKCWRRIDNRLLLYKRANKGGVNLNKEHFAECIASDIGKLLKLNCVSYWRDKWHNEDCSVCKIFTTKDKGYLPFRYFLQAIEPSENKWNFTSAIKWIPEEFKQDFLDMIVFDFIIENRDRHLENFGFIIDNDNQNILSFAPLFDHGYSLMSNSTEDSFNKDLINYSEYHPSFILKNNDLATYVIKKDKLRYKCWSNILKLNIDNINWVGCPKWYEKGIKKLILARCNIIDSI